MARHLERVRRPVLDAAGARLNGLEWLGAEQHRKMSVRVRLPNNEVQSRAPQGSLAFGARLWPHLAVCSRAAPGSEPGNAVIPAWSVAAVHRLQAFVPARAIAVLAHGWGELAGGLERAYSLGEQPITRLKAVLNALSEA